jgi:hypothetical protein
METPIKKSIIKNIVIKTFNNNRTLIELQNYLALTIIEILQLKIPKIAICLLRMNIDK